MICRIVYKYKSDIVYKLDDLECCSTYYKPIRRQIIGFLVHSKSPIPILVKFSTSPTNKSY